MRQYEIWWADLPEPIGSRPVFLLSRDAAYRYLTRVVVAEITTTVRNIPQEVPLGPPEGLKGRSVVNLDNLHTVAKKHLRARVGALAPGRIVEVKQALGYVLDWLDLKSVSSA